VLKRWHGLLATVAVLTVTLGMVTLDVTDPGFRRWWTERALTAGTVAGLLVLLLTVLVVDQFLEFRQTRDRAQATAAQAAIVLSQAVRSTKAVSAALDSRDREAATNEVRTYMTMLLIAAPVLMDADVPRHFLEQAQRLAAELARGLAAAAKSPSAATATNPRLDAAADQLQNSAIPLLRVLNARQQAAVSGDEQYDDTTTGAS